MKKIIKITSCLALVLIGIMVLASCDQIKQIISDTAAPIIEEKVNDMLKESGVEGDFKLPEAKRYEGFDVVEDDVENTTTYTVNVIEPTVTFEEYANDLATTLGAEFDVNEALKEVEGKEEWAYTDEDGTVYTVNFVQNFKEDGVTIDNWQIKVVVDRVNPVE